MKKCKSAPKYNFFQNTLYMLDITYKTDKSVIVIAVLTALASVGIQLTQLYIAPQILGAIESRAMLSELLLKIATFTLALFLLNSLLGYLNANSTTANNNVFTALTLKMRQKDLTTSYANFDNLDYVNEKRHASEGFRRNGGIRDFWVSLSGLLKDILGFIIYLLLLVAFDPILMIIVVLTTLIGAAIERYLRGWYLRHREEVQVLHGRLYYTRKRAEDANFAKDFRLYGMENWIQSIFATTLLQLEIFDKKYSRVLFFGSLSNFVVTLIRNGAAYWFCIVLTLEQNLPTSQFLLYFTAITGFSAWISGIMEHALTLHSVGINISVTREYLDFDEPFNLSGGLPLEPQKKQYELSLKSVSFRYAGAEKDTIKNLDLTIKRGEKIAVVGLNGAGKTTLIKLLCGLYDPTEGTVLLDGKDIKDYNRRDYYRHFATVFQQFSILKPSIKQNIIQAYSKDDARIAECVDKAGLTEVIAALPNGIETHLGRTVFEDGIDLSGGQLQRLMLARALYKNAPILFLDEPTAALDPLAEQDMYERYYELSKDSTSVFISHRLASTRFCDRILYMENGELVEEGTHEELLNQGGKYADLFNLQSKYYQKEI